MNNFSRVLLILAVGIIAFSRVANAHYPHDDHQFVTLSPFFSSDSTVYVSQKQGASIRPHVALVSRNEGFTWEFNPVGMDNTSKFTSASVSPLYDVDGTVFMTTANEGVYRSQDRGMTWETVNQGLPAKNLSDSAAVLDDSGLVNLFVSRSSGGIYRTSDLGSTWDTLLADNGDATVFSVSSSYAVDGTILTGGATGLLHISTDAGANFSEINALTGIGYITQIIFSPDYSTSGVIYVATSAGLYRSDDYAATFVKIDSLVTDIIYALGVSPNYAADSTLFAATPTEVYKSTDAGNSWSLLDIGIEFSLQSAAHIFDIQLSEDYVNDSTVYLATFEGVFRSGDGGSSWFQLDTRPPDLIMGVALSPDFETDGLILASTYGAGLYVSRDAGDTWTAANTGVSNTYTYQVEIRRGAGADPILIASQQNHALVSTNYGASWTRSEVTGVLPKDCIPSAMDASPTYDTDATIVMGCRKRGFVATYDGGVSWQLLFTESQLAGGTVTSAQLSTDFVNDPTMFFTDARGNFLRSFDSGVNWEVINSGLPTSNYWFGGNAVVLSPDYAIDNSLLGVTAKGLFLSIDSGDNWLSIPGPSPVATGVIEYAEFAPDFFQQATILASVRGRGFFRSSDYGSSWQQAGIGLLENGYELKGFAVSPGFTQDGTVIGFGHNHIFRSVDRGDSFELIDLPFVRHEDVRVQSIIYLGNWVEIDDEASSGTTFTANATNGDIAALPFWGTGVSWIGIRANILGIARVYIDGQFVAEVDQYSPTPLRQETLYSISNLTPGIHVIYVVTTNEKNPDALSNFTIIDAFDVVK